MTVTKLKKLRPGNILIMTLKDMISLICFTSVAFIDWVKLPTRIIANLLAMLELRYLLYSMSTVDRFKNNLRYFDDDMHCVLCVYSMANEYSLANNVVNSNDVFGAL
jgi:hypothetical protein